ncbi:UDP-rhamnose:rhamnosyltransferase 1 [Populus alba x Populus x berolinensis]|uniref:UDP-rhamnose:rhamnosyltransferase 1 n=1 Tax=Populus alba x Populus x berolinensis TaxID=444605 RepID=A0AAD6WDD3_9ROSI|nr:UDP-rhamnose:rhamnosyltransferase 1 [Populus alba x Populus x berolinensis]
MASDLHIVVFPWSAFGHILPFFHFSKALAEAGVHVSFVSTPRNIQRLPAISPTLAPLINLVELPFPALDVKYGLPEGAEATVDIPAEKIQYLKIAYDLLQHPFKQFVAEKSPNWIIVDFCSPWAVDIAKEYGIPLIYLSIFSGATRAFMRHPGKFVGDGQKRFRRSPESLTSPPEWITFPSSVAFRSYEAKNMYPAMYGENASGIRDAERVAKTVSGCQAIGLLPPEKPEKREITDGTWNTIFEWLDNQEHESVVFVGFGSECKLTKDQVYEIAYGLELSKLPYLWALRKPTWAATDLDVLPPEFNNKTSEKGIVSIGWAPQLELLSHPSIGGSLFHSGWGSVIETLQYGLCLIVLPFIADQGLNARLLVEKGLAVEVDRNAKSLRLAMASEEGSQLKTRAKDAANMFQNRKLHQDYINRFVKYLKDGVS